ncbi:MAG: type II toxin-antitoxin system VapC family toxin [bacterium]|nr:type II toxin-antitoxin system VapC family toxin [bacterium]MCY4193087.1 type II toxin-antitoxin system VapC family toxin [bacterium]MCY4271141.1 type II toxin-antitoxin system VapC family toxin [bacterium]
MIVPDVNLLVYAYNEDAPYHEQARTWWEGLANGAERVGFPWMVVAGFVRIVTQHRTAVRPVPPEQAVDLVAEWLSLPQVAPLNPGAQHLAIFRRLVVATGVGGNLTTDAHIAALAIEHQGEVHSNDSDFARFPGLRWRNPLLP